MNIYWDNLQDMYDEPWTSDFKQYIGICYMQEL